MIQSLLRPEAYPHDVTELSLLETHISWVILTGPFAYKIKKPIKLEFLDFSSLEKRKHFCDVELKLNRRWCPELYLGVVPIRQQESDFAIDGTGSLTDYAVKMKQFPQSARLDEQLDAGLLDMRDMLSFAETLAAQHQKARIITTAETNNSLNYITHPMLENFAHVSRCIDPGMLERLKLWTENSLYCLEATLVSRQRDGFVRECHGDLHLENMVRLEAGVRAFDCVEFNPELRNIDVLSDVAFLVMDLVARKRCDLAYQFLNRYLELTGDYAGMRVFDLYFVYHCMIRAKVAAIRGSEHAGSAAAGQDQTEVMHYIEVARNRVARPFPKLLAMHGFSGSGKTWLSGQLMSALPAIRLRSDIERKRCNALRETDHSGSELGGGIYAKRASVEVYDRLRYLATVLLVAGHTVILDAAFLAADERRKLSATAGRLGVRLLFISTSASSGELQVRLRRRASSGKDASEAGPGVLRLQRQAADAFTTTEAATVISVPTDNAPDISALIKRIAACDNATGFPDAPLAQAG